jgi:hypothetical protein
MDPDTRLGLHMTYLRTDATFAHAGEYRQLWHRYTSTMAAPPSTRAQQHQALQGWQAWGTDPQQGLTPQQQQLTAGPAAEITTWRRATINGTRFREESMDPTDTTLLKKKSLGSYFLARTQHTAADGSADYRFQLGRAVFFFQHSPPGAADSTVQEFVCARWALVPSPSHTTSGLPMVVLDRWRAARADEPFVCSVAPLNIVEPCEVGLGALDSKHGVPRRVTAGHISGSQLSHYHTTSAVVNGTAEDATYCERLAAATQTASTRPTCSTVRLAAVLTPYCWMSEKFVSFERP